MKHLAGRSVFEVLDDYRELLDAHGEEAGPRDTKSILSYRRFLEKNLDRLAISPGLLLPLAYNAPQDSVQYLDVIQSGLQPRHTWLRRLTPPCTDPNPAMWSLHERHEGRVHSVIISSCGRFAASGGSDGKTVFWDLSSGRQQVRETHAAAVLCVSLAPNGKRVVSGGRDAKVVAWDVVSGHCDTMDVHSVSVLTVLAAQDGQRVVSGARDGRVVVWDIDSGRHQTLRGHSAAVKTMSVTPDGRSCDFGGPVGTRYLLGSGDRPTQDHGDAFRRRHRLVAHPRRSKSGFWR